MDSKSTAYTNLAEIYGGLVPELTGYGDGSGREMETGRKIGSGATGGVGKIGLAKNANRKVNIKLAGFCLRLSAN